MSDHSFVFWCTLYNLSFTLYTRAESQGYSGIWSIIQLLWVIIKCHMIDQGGLWVINIIYEQTVLTGLFLSNFFHPASGDLLSLYPVITPPRDCKHSSIHKNMPYERSNIYKSALWVIIYFPMSDQKHSYDCSHSCSERSQRVFLSNFFHPAPGDLLSLYPVITPPRDIQAFTKICHMSDHNIFMSDQTFINQLCERSYISLWAIKSILMIAHTLVLSAHRGFFCPISFIMPWKSIFPISSVILCSRKQL
jgi:hypothetical protein